MKVELIESVKSDSKPDAYSIRFAYGDEDRNGYFSETNCLVKADSPNEALKKAKAEIPKKYESARNFRFDKYHNSKGVKNGEVVAIADFKKNYPLSNITILM